MRIAENTIRLVENDVSFKLSSSSFSFIQSRSSHRELSSKKCVLKNFAKFTGKHRCCEIFKKTFFTEHLQWLLLSFEWRLLFYFRSFLFHFMILLDLCPTQLTVTTTFFPLMVLHIICFTIITRRGKLFLLTLACFLF